MAFNSLEYLLLLLGSVLLFFGSSYRWRLVVLICASCLFYATWSLPFVGLIFVSAVVDFFAARRIDRWNHSDEATAQRKRKLALLVSLAVNLGLLGYFKYANFFLENVHAVLGSQPGEGLVDVLLPPGISFYTFQTMSYTMDVYWRRV